MIDLYQILQVPSNADQATIQKAYKKLAKRYHPDRHHDATEEEKSKAQNLFREVKQAYEVLGDEERRHLYDKYGDIALNPNFKGFPNASENHSRDFNSFFSDFGDRSQSSKGTRPYEGSYRRRTTIQDEQREKERKQQQNSWGSREYSERTKGQSFTDRFNSGSFENPFSKTDFDDFQNQYSRSSRTSSEDPFFGFGTGSSNQSRKQSRTSKRTSSTRKSKTSNYSNYQERSSTKTISQNTPQKGADILLSIKIEFREAIFGGERKITVNRPMRWVPSTITPEKTPMEKFEVSINIPQGVVTGEQISVSEKGNPGKNGGIYGDLVVLVEVLPHPHLYREGPNVFMNVPISLHEALYGTSIIVPTPNKSSLRVQIPPKMKNGQKLRLKGRGLPRRNNSLIQQTGSNRQGIQGGQGDLFLVIRIVLPESEDPLLEQKLKSIADELSMFYPSEGVRKDWKI